MEKILNTLNDVQPILMLSALALFYVTESFIPYFSRTSRIKHSSRNLFMNVLTIATNILLSTVFVGGIMWASQNRFGILNWLHIAGWPAIISGIFLLDLGSYCLHIITHKVPLLWRYHRVHHSDTELDSTSGFRFHPLEIIMQNLWQTGFLMLLGMPIASAILYYTFFLPWLVAEHSNIRFPQWFEKYASWLIVTPGWHKVHHSSYRPETDSHYADLFTIWDRLFGTHKEVNVDKINYGIEQFREEKDHTVVKQLLMPLEPLNTETPLTETNKAMV